MDSNQWQNNDIYKVKSQYQENSNINIGIASYITAYARIVLHELISKIISKGFKVFYCDTDSIITDIKLTDHEDLMNTYRKNNDATALGALKNERGVIFNPETQ